MTLELGQRRSYNGELCTVLFSGQIAAWPDEHALGVEWDTPGKGKHSGEHGGVRYFTTRRPGNGSFVKAKKKHDGSRSVYEALVYSYGTEVAIEEIQIGKKMIEIYGFEKLQRMQKDFTSLRDISLSRKQVEGVKDAEEEELLGNSLPKLERLDLSFNLIIDFGHVVRLLRNLDLRSLNLTGNRFTKNTSISQEVPLSKLNLTMTYPSQELLSTLPKIFTKLQELSLCDDELKTLPSFILNLPKLDHLDLSMNELTQIPEILMKSNITTLNLADNDISITPTAFIFTTITSLDLQRNNIKDWSEIDILTYQFPNVTEFRMSENPIFEGHSLEEVEFQVIARWPTITKLNGVDIIKTERENAELWFLSKVNSGEIKYDKSKADVLRQMYGRTGTIEDIQDSNLIQLKFQFGDKVIELDVIQSIEVLRLKSLLSRVLKKPFLQIQLTYQYGSFKELLSNETSQISSYGFTNGQILTIEVV